jgi:hypothetical protein
MSALLMLKMSIMGFQKNAGPVIGDGAALMLKLSISWIDI